MLTQVPNNNINIKVNTVAADIVAKLKTDYEIGGVNIKVNIVAIQKFSQYSC